MLLVIMLVGAAISAVIASVKQRSVFTWLVFGGLFPLISAIVLLCLPPVDAQITSGES